MNAFIVKFLLLLAIVRGFPLKDHRDENNPELTDGYFEGDIVLNVNRNGLIDKFTRWPNNIVYYKFREQNFDAEHRNYILTAMRSIEKVSCIRFEDATGTSIPYYVYITGYPNGCRSHIGCTSTVQTFNLEIFPLGEGCFKLGEIVHELLHTLGFFHMQNDSNRDNYVKIVEENVTAGKMKNFVKMEADVVDNFGQEYDYASIMHYDPYAFSKNGKKTIIALKDTPTVDLMGQRHMMRNSDIVKLNKMYNCPKEVQKKMAGEHHALMHDFI